ncbi:hypothetical protein [Saliphagus infecundisoli]|uniref:DUF8054 domain-containing protein n=1 Tax=Saliphagus infecundisoli TaxID=1849069 RepID=A0ABD5QBP3_9EURY|nr:hypothetical protein [Saliphagus infecundisoli]
MAVPDALDGLRRPEFTGDARCWPCTVLNGTILWMAVTVVAMAGRLRLAAALGIVGIAAIWLRGYLVPYTPRFAPRLAAVLPGDPFDHAREVGSLADVVDVGDERAAAILDEALESGRLAPDARRAWREAAARYRELEVPDLAARVSDRVPAEARAERRWGTDYVVLDAPDGQTLCPRPVAVADLAAADALEAAAGPAGERERLAAADPFRALLESCPLCGDTLAIARSPCCGAAPPGTATDERQLVCEACPVRLYVYDES